MNRKLDMYTYKKGQVWMMKDVWTEHDRDMQLTIGDRPVLIINNVNVRGKFVTVIPFTTSESVKSGVFVNLEPGTLSTALVHEIKPVASSSLTVFLGSLNERVMDEIDTALKIYLGLEYNPELENRYFKHSTDKCLTINDKINKVSNNTIIVKESKTSKKVSDTKNTDKKNRATFNKLNNEDKTFIINSDVDSIVKKFEVTISTVYRWKRLLKDINKVNSIVDASSKSESIKPVEQQAFKLITTNKYSNKVYSKFAAKKLINLSLNDKKLFTKLDSCKLATTMNIPLDTICTAQAQFLKEINNSK